MCVRVARQSLFDVYAHKLNIRSRFTLYTLCAYIYTRGRAEASNASRAPSRFMISIYLYSHCSRVGVGEV